MIFHIHELNLHWGLFDVAMIGTVVDQLVQGFQSHLIGALPEYK